MLRSLITLLGLASSAAAFSASGSNNIALYWGQNSAGGSSTQERLSAYCKSDSADIMILSFLTTFYSTGGLPSVDFSNACSDGSYLADSSLLQCPTIAEDIATCQSLGKKVLLSLGGASGSYGFTDDDEAESFADELWNLFGGGSSDTRPFGTSIIDGFDLDIEGGSSTGYGAFANKMKKHYDSDSSKDYYLSAAPQCPYPDAYVGAALTEAPFDFLFVQFYNNYCGMQEWEADNANANFNYESWDSFVKSSPNPNAKVYLGVPGSSSAAGSGYESASTVSEAASYLQETYGTFGGVMIWDASQAWNNEVSNVNFAESIKSVLNEGSSSTGSSGSSSAAAGAVSTSTPVSEAVSTSSKVFSSSSPAAAVSSTPVYQLSSSAEAPTTSSSAFISVVSSSAPAEAVSSSAPAEVFSSSTPVEAISSSVPPKVASSSEPGDTLPSSSSAAASATVSVSSTGSVAGSESTSSAVVDVSSSSVSFAETTSQEAPTVQATSTSSFDSKRSTFVTKTKSPSAVTQATATLRTITSTLPNSQVTSAGAASASPVGVKQMTVTTTDADGHPLVVIYRTTVFTQWVTEPNVYVTEYSTLYT